MKVVIGGTGKSGTTALTYKVAKPLPGCRVLFEPVERRAALETANHTVVKIKLRSARDYARAAAYREFDRRVLLLRDPRDWLISRQLYLWYSRNLSSREFNTFITRLKRKEAAPASVSFLDLSPSTLPLQDQLETLNDFVQLKSRLVAEGWFPFRYEAMVTADFGRLNDYLGFDVDAGAEVDARHQRVVRSKASGNWRHWLTSRDVEQLRPQLSKSLRQLGYNEGDWCIAVPQALDPRLGSDYVMKLRGNLPQRWYRGARRRIRNALRC